MGLRSLVGNQDIHKSLDDQISSLTMELSALEHLKNIVSPGFLHKLYSDLFNTCRKPELVLYLECLNIFLITFKFRVFLITVSSFRVTCV